MPAQFITNSRAIFFVLTCFIIISASSCKLRQYVYTPTPMNALQADEKNDLKVALNYSTAGDLLIFGSETKRSSGIDLQTLYAVSPRVALKLDGYFKSERNSLEDFTFGTSSNSYLNYKKRNIELSAGVFNFSKDKQFSIFQLYGGIGLGNTYFKGLFDAASSQQINNYSADFLKYFIQPSISVRGGPNYIFTVGSRISLLNYKNIETDYADIKNEIIGYIDSKPSVFIDLMINNEFGFSSLPGIRFQTQIGATNLLTRFTDLSTSTGLRDRYDYNTTWFNLGVIADMNTLLKKK